MEAIAIIDALTGRLSPPQERPKEEPQPKPNSDVRPHTPSDEDDLGEEGATVDERESEDHGATAPNVNSETVEDTNVLTENRAEGDDESFSKGGMHGIIRRGSQALNSLVGSLMHGRPNDAREGAVSPLDEQVGHGRAPKTMPQPPAQADDSMPERLNPRYWRRRWSLSHMSQTGTPEYRREAWYGAVQRCVLLRNLPTNELKFVCQGTRVIKTSPGDVLYEQGDVPNMMFLVHSGSYAATISTPSSGGSWKARDYGPMDSFGACELLSPDLLARGRACTIRVTTGGIVWGIPKRIVDLKLRAPPLNAVPGLLQFAKKLDLFKPLSENMIIQLCRSAHLKDVNKEDYICKQGDPARSIFTVWKGTAFSSQSQSSFSMTMKPPTTFGESALFYDEALRTRQASVQAGEGGAVVIRWPVNEIETLIGYELHKASEQLYTRKFLSSVRFGTISLFNGLTDDLVTHLMASLRTVTFDVGKTVVAHGNMDESVFIVKSGAAKAVMSAEDKARAPGGGSLATLEKADYFGEAAFLHSGLGAKQHKRRTSMVVHGDSPLVLFAIDVLGLMKFEQLRPWLKEFADWVSTHPPTNTGMDLLIEQKISQAGTDLHSLFIKQKAGKKGKSYAQSKTR